MIIQDTIKSLKEDAYKLLDQSKRGQLGQFYTPFAISRFMASLFQDISGNVRLLDPGCGIGSLTGAFIEEAKARKQYESLNCSLIDIEEKTSDLAQDFIRKINNLKNITATYENADFIHGTPSFFEEDIECNKKSYTHCIMNPPYKKISAAGKHRKLLREKGIETGNLYSAFVALALKKLITGGELVAIIPRSFCNGPYFKPFRDLILSESAIKHIHIFESRTKTFKEDKVLQENIIIHLIKGVKQGKVILSSSVSGNFIDCNDDSIQPIKIKSREVSFDTIVKPYDEDKFIYITVDETAEKVLENLSHFTSNLEDIGVSVSTGPVVEFRSREFLLNDYKQFAVPLLYPAHFSRNKIKWPSQEKPNALLQNYPKKNDFWLNKETFLVVNRFSAKEEKRRITAHIFYEFTDSKYIAFENKLNVYHIEKKGFSLPLAKGLYIYLNSTLVDQLFRQFSGHTQVNATDLRNLHYPSTSQLNEIGNSFSEIPQDQESIDAIFKTFRSKTIKKGLKL